LGDLSVDGRITLKWIVRVCTGITLTASLEHGNEPSDSLKGGVFLD